MKSSVLTLLLFLYSSQVLAQKITRAFPQLKFNEPTFLTSAPGLSHFLFVTEKAGRIIVFPHSQKATKDEAKVFLDLRSKVRSRDSETGLLSLAFSPDFSKSREFFVAYTREDLALVVAKLKSSADFKSAELSSFKEVILIPKRRNYANHNGGMIAFGPDKMLYIGTGDGGGADDPQGNGQDKTQLLGKILRIDVLGADPYQVPKDNPFKGEKSAREEIWAFGMRNPWRFSFDRTTQKLWAADVGQNKLEEVNVISRSGNYGWNVFEGTQNFKNPKRLSASKFIRPVHEYSREDGISITGGYVYRGKRHKTLQGRYLFGDYGSGKIWALNPLKELGSVEALSSWGEDNEGEVYMLSLSGELWHFE